MNTKTTRETIGQCHRSQLLLWLWWDCGQFLGALGPRLWAVLQSQRAAVFPQAGTVITLCVRGMEKGVVPGGEGGVKKGSHLSGPGGQF